MLALADVAKFFNLPTILTTSFENGPNGPIVPELKEIFPHAPYIPRPGQINAWDNEDFVNAIKETARTQLIIAAVVTDACVAFPALSATEAGYKVYVVVDASGTFNMATWRMKRWLPRHALAPTIEGLAGIGGVEQHGVDPCPGSTAADPPGRT